MVVEDLMGAGLSVRTISAGTGIPRSSVFLADLDRSWRRHGGGERCSTAYAPNSQIYFQVMVKLMQVWMLSKPNGFDRRRNRKEVLQRLEDIEQLQHLTNGA